MGGREKSPTAKKRTFRTGSNYYAFLCIMSCFDKPDEIFWLSVEIEVDSKIGDWKK
jgi:hypothetical protein